jgi:hypothetical protein
MIGQLETGSSKSDHIYYTLFSRVSVFAVPFIGLSRTCTSAGPKSFSSNFNLQGHILSTAGDALTEPCILELRTGT